MVHLIVLCGLGIEAKSDLSTTLALLNSIRYLL